MKAPPTNEFVIPRPGLPPPPGRGYPANLKPGKNFQASLSKVYRAKPKHKVRNHFLNACITEKNHIIGLNNILQKVVSILYSCLSTQVNIFEKNSKT